MFWLRTAETTIIFYCPTALLPYCPTALLPYLMLPHRLAKRLESLTFADRAFFANSGAEANEAALKLARRVAFDRHGADKVEIVSFVQSFHGRTFFTVSVGGQPKYSDRICSSPDAGRG